MTPLFRWSGDTARGWRRRRGRRSDAAEPPDAEREGCVAMAAVVVLWFSAPQAVIYIIKHT